MSEVKNLLLTGARSGFGALIARSLMQQGCVAFATMRDATGEKAAGAVELAEFTAPTEGSPHVLELDDSRDAAVEQAVADVVLQIIETPAGERPLRLVVDPMTGGEAPKLLNSTSSTIQAELLNGLGMDELGSVEKR